MRRFTLFIFALPAFALGVTIGLRPVRADNPVPGQFQIPDTAVTLAGEDELKAAAVTEHPNAAVPLDLALVDEKGNAVHLKDYFQPGRPVVLQLGYLECPALCDMMSKDLVQTLRDLGLHGGKDFEFVFVSINPSDISFTASAKKNSLIEALGHPEEADGYHYLTAGPGAIHDLASSVGFGFKNVTRPPTMMDRGVTTPAYVHPAVLMVLTPDGRIFRYLYGIDYPAQTLRLSLVQASQGQIGTASDHIILMFCDFDRVTGKYAVVAVKVMRFGALATLLLVACGIFLLFARERRLHHRVKADAAQDGAEGGTTQS